jgi:hypothetical protein
MRLQLPQKGRLTEAMKPTLPMPSAKAYSVAGARGFGIGHRCECRDLARERFDHLVRQQDFATVPQVLRIERHELDVSNLKSVLTRVARQRDNIGLHQILHRHRIQLHGVAEALAGVEAIEDFAEIVAPRDLKETIAVERIDVDVDAPKPGLMECFRLIRSRTPLVVSARSRIPSISARRRISRGRSRRSSGSPPVTRSLRMPSVTPIRTKRSISSKSRISGARHEMHVRLRHAVKAADVAAVGQR